MKLRVRESVLTSPDVLHVRLEHPLRPDLPRWTAGAHVDLKLPDGRTRQYSLCGDPADRSCYEVAIKREPNGRGGSTWAHANLAPEMIVHVSAPRNNFPLSPAASRHVFVAGGVGVTPFVAMAKELVACGGNFELHLCARSEADAPLLGGLRTLCGQQLRCWFSSQGRRFDPSTLGPAEPGTHVYACGPQRLIDPLQTMLDAEGWPPEQVHIERFAVTLNENYKAEPFEALIRSTGERLLVPADASLLEVLHRNGVTIPSSCGIGVCGSCECGYLNGTVVHRDILLPVSKRQDRIMPCVSRARGVLTLDL